MGLNPCLKVVRYTFEEENIKEPIRMAFLTDLHSCYYGKEQKNLIEAIEKEHPDLILLGGDIFDEVLNNEKAWELIDGISSDYPCYYVTGNHEWRTSDIPYFKARLEESGVHVLEGDVLTYEKNESRIRICGIDDPNVGNDEFREQIESCNSQIKKEEVTILLTHRPELMEYYSEYDFDYVMAGHAHGGQWRIPGLVNGLYVPSQGLLPEYTGGIYREYGKTLILSRGLARESTGLPRFYNRPELVIVDFM